MTKEQNKNKHHKTQEEYFTKIKKVQKKIYQKFSYENFEKKLKNIPTRIKNNTDKNAIRL